jgi:hypothetical protein
MEFYDDDIDMLKLEGMEGWDFENMGSEREII